MRIAFHHLGEARNTNNRGTFLADSLTPSSPISMVLIANTSIFLHKALPEMREPGCPRRSGHDREERERVAWRTGEVLTHPTQPRRDAAFLQARETGDSTSGRGASTMGLLAAIGPA